jgi:hypothetical protein
VHLVRAIEGQLLRANTIGPKRHAIDGDRRHTPTDAMRIFDEHVEPSPVHMNPRLEFLP